MAATSTTCFSPAALKFLADLGRHNEREWFNARKGIYESELKAPLLALIAEVNEALLRFAPEHVRPPQKAMMRIYRDIRFSPNKDPYKTNVSAWWSRDGIQQTTGAGYYVSISPKGVVVAAGAYEPDKDQMLAIRGYLTEHHEEFGKMLSEKKLKAAFPVFDGNPRRRPPKGFVEASPEVMPWLLCRQWAISTTLPAETAHDPGFAKEIAGRFRLAAPFVGLLNRPLLAKPRKPLF